MSDRGMTLTGKGIEYASLLALKGAVHLETLGMKHSRGSMSAQACKLLGLPIRTRKQKVYDALVAHIEKWKAQHELEIQQGIELHGEPRIVDQCVDLTCEYRGDMHGHDRNGNVVFPYDEVQPSPRSSTIPQDLKERLP